MDFSFIRTRVKLINFFRRTQLDRELAEEIETHRLLLSQALKEHGADDCDVSKRMGNITLAREESRDMWSFRALDEVCRDLRLSFRGLLRNPVFSATAVLSLALGIGANTAIFTAVSAIFLKPLAVRDPATLVTFSAVDQRGQSIDSFPLDFARQLQSSGAFSDVIATSSDGLSFQFGNGRAERIMGEVVTPNFFSALGLKTVAGTGFSADVRDGKWAAEAVLSYSFWKSRFAGDPNIIGRVIRLNTYPFIVVGVSPPSFYDLHQGQNPELRIPLLPPGRTVRELNILNPEQDFELMARLAPGISHIQGQTAADVQLHEFTRTRPNLRKRVAGFRMLPGDRGWPELAGDFKTPLTVLFLLVVLVLLIACMNVANMSLARTEARRREIAVRSALGAGRVRLIQHMITESILLALSAGLVGWMVARYVSQFLLHFLPQGHIHLVLDLHPGKDSVAFTFGLSLAAAMLFGLTAACQGTRGELAAGLKSDSNGSMGASDSYTLKKLLMVGQIAFSLALLIVAGLFIRTVGNLQPHTSFANASRILVFTMKPQEEIYSPDRIRSMTAELIRRIAAVPGVEAVSLAENGPFASRQNTDTLEVAGRNPVEASDDSVLPGFFHTLQLPVLAGRDFTTGDKPDSPKVIIINQLLATALFADENPLGRLVEMPSSHGSQFFRVVGVVGNFHYYDPRRIRPAAFYAFQNDPPYMPTVHVRIASSNAASYIPAIRREFDAVDKGFPIFNVRTLSDRIEDALARERMIADLSTMFGLLALSLAAVGLYGVFTYSVTQRTREIGLRMALGSKISSVLWLIIQEAFLLVAIGVGFGSAVAVGGAYLISNQLYGVRPADPLTLFACALAMLMIALIAVSLPAWKASRIDPMIALRHE